MQRPLSTMLLQGAKTWAGRMAVEMIAAVMAAAVMAAALVAAPLAAQDASSVAKHFSAAGHLEVAVRDGKPLANKKQNALRTRVHFFEQVAPSSRLCV